MKKVARNRPKMKKLGSKMASGFFEKRQKESMIPTAGYFWPPGSPGRPRAGPESRKRPIGKREKGPEGKKASGKVEKTAKLERESRKEGKEEGLRKARV